MRQTKQKTKPKGYWRSAENRRKFFEEFASEQGFDPSIAANWKDVTQAQVLTKKVVNFIYLCMPSPI